MKIIVTGGNGFIGKFLIKHLIEKNHQITSFDNYSNSNEEYFNELTKLGVKTIQGDIRKQEEISKAARGHDVIIHLAAKISVEDSIKNPDETFGVNVEGTRNVLTSCLNNDIKNLIIISSAAVYGNRINENEILFENSKTEPISPYGKSKLMMEEIVKEFSNLNKINCIILRIFNVYGPGQSDEYAGVITKFIKNAKKGKPLKIFGDGMQTRDFISIYDVISIIANSLLKLENKRGEIYNIATGETITIGELANLILSLTGGKSKVEFLKPLDADIRFSNPSIKNAEDEINFNPKIKLKNGLQKFIGEL
jgi:UDP-glucose 4-epimerase